MTRAAMARPMLLAAMLAAGTVACTPQAGSAAPPLPTQPRARNTPPPVYPPELACADVGGLVVLNLTVTAEGHVADVRLVHGSKVPELDQAAATAVQKWTFAPATSLGKPIAKRIEVPVTFTPPQVRPDQCFALDSQRKS